MALRPEEHPQRNCTYESWSSLSAKAQGLGQVVVGLVRPADNSFLLKKFCLTYRECSETSKNNGKEGPYPANPTFLIEDSAAIERNRLGYGLGCPR